MASENSVDKLHVDMWHVGLPSPRQRKHVGGKRSRTKGGPLISGDPLTLKLRSAKIMWISEGKDLPPTRYRNGLPTPINLSHFKLLHDFIFFC